MTASGPLHERNDKNLTELIAEFVGIPDFRRDAVVDAALRRSLLDTVGCIVANLDRPQLREVARAMAVRDGGTRLFGGSGLRFDPRLAAMLHGIAAHWNEFDDYDLRAGGHPGAVVISAALTGAVEAGCSGRDLLDAIFVGYEVFALLGFNLKGEARRSGLHLTGIAGPIAAASAIARIRHLTVGQTSTAIGVAASQSAGLCVQFGSATKAFHAGHAAMAGTVAVDVARAGFSAADDSLGAPDGLVHSLVGPERRREVLDLLLRRGIDSLGTFVEALPPGLKFFAACATAHSGIDCAVQLREQIGPTNLDEIERIEVRVPSSVLGSLVHHQPRTPAEAQFSSEFTVALALVHGDVRPEGLTASAISDPRIRRLMARTEVVPDDGFEQIRADTHSVPTELRVYLGDRDLECTVTDARGSSRCPPSWAEVEEKFLANVVPSIGADRASEIAYRVRHVDDITQIRSELRVLLTETEPADRHPVPELG